MTGVALQGPAVPPPEPPPDELEPASFWPPPDIIMVAPDELEPAILVFPPDELEPAILMVPPDELEPVVIMGMGAPEELELDELVPVMVGDPDPPEPDEVEAPEAAPLDPLGPKSVGPPLLEVDPFVAVPPDPEELAPPEPSDPSGIPEEHPATAPASPQRIAKVLRRCIVLCFSSGRCLAEGLKYIEIAVSRKLCVCVGTRRSS